MAFRALRISDVKPISAVEGTLLWHPLRHGLGVSGLGSAVLAVGGEPGKPFEVSASEWSFRARPHLDAGEWEQAIAIIADGLAAHPGDGSLLYNLACCEARLGRLDEADAHVREALADEPRVREWGAEDPDLDPLRERPDFPL